jgi:hypothetical protein
MIRHETVRKNFKPARVSGERNVLDRFGHDSWNRECRFATLDAKGQ